MARLIGLADGIADWRRWVAVGAALMSAVLLRLAFHTTAWKQYFARNTGWKQFFGGADAGFVAFAGAFAVAVAGDFAGAGAFAFVVAFTVAVAGAGAVAQRKGYFFVYLATVSILYFVAVYGTVYLVTDVTAIQGAISLLIAIVLLPLINAPFDWLSIGLTRTLLRKNIVEPKLHLRGLYSLLDLAGAMVLMVLLAVAMVVALEAVNGVAALGGFSGTAIEVKAQLLDIEGNPGAAAHYWLYFAVFSTLLPTLFHLGIWLLSINTLQNRMFEPWLVQQLNDKVSAGFATNRLVELLITLRFVAPIVISVGVAAVIAYLSQYLVGFGTWLIGILLKTQAIVDAMF